MANERPRSMWNTPAGILCLTAYGAAAAACMSGYQFWAFIAFIMAASWHGMVILEYDRKRRGR